jgi:hypothetical protein
MESEPQPTATPSDVSDTPPQLAPGGGPLSRLTSHAQGLSDDVRSWLELRYELAKIELFERLDERLDQIILFAIVGGLAAVGGAVMLLATCFAASWVISALTGWTIGALFLGFLLVALLFLTLAGLIFAVKPRFGLLEDKTRATLSEKRVMGGRAAGERVPSEENSSEENSSEENSSKENTSSE